MEKIIRLYDLGRPDADPELFPAQTSGIRCLAFLQNDNILLASQTDTKGILWVTSGPAKPFF